MAGFEFDRKKFEELIVYIAKRLPPEAALIATESPSDADVEYFQRLHGLAA